MGVQPEVPSAVLASRVPAPQGLCAGAETLPPARVSTQLGGRIDPSGAAEGRCCCREGAVWVRVTHSSRSPQDISKRSFQIKAQGRGCYKEKELF